MNTDTAPIAGFSIPSFTDDEAPTSRNVVIELIAMPAMEMPVPDPAMFFGLAGDAVRMLEPHTESDPVAILISLLVGAGIAIGRGPYFEVDATRHYTNLFAVLVGSSSTARKGTAWNNAKSLLSIADQSWSKSRILGGLSSGEGLIHAVRDPQMKKEPIKDKGKITGYQDVLADEGEADKRLLVIETEFAKTLRVSERETNTLSPLIRQAWESGELRVMTKDPKVATDAHIGILGHITPEELRREMSATAITNGLANRFLWVHVQRSKLLPLGGNLPAVKRSEMGVRLAGAIEFGRTVEEVRLTDEAKTFWRSVYPHLNRERPGLLGAITSRATPIVLRLSTLFALLDEERYIHEKHLRASLAVCEYAEASARCVFGDSLGDPVADEILRLLQKAPNGLNRTRISDGLSRNKDSAKVDAALTLLHTMKRIRGEKHTTQGRPADWWFAV